MALYEIPVLPLAMFDVTGSLIVTALIKSTVLTVTGVPEIETV